MDIVLSGIDWTLWKIKVEKNYNKGCHLYVFFQQEVSMQRPPGSLSHSQKKNSACWGVGGVVGRGGVALGQQAAITDMYMSML